MKCKILIYSLLLVISSLCAQTQDKNFNHKVEKNISVSVSTPTITVTEVDPLSVMSTPVGNSSTQNINVSGVNLTDSNGITLEITGSNAVFFSLSTNNIPQTGGTALNTVVVISYSPTSEGSHTAMLTLSSSGASNVTRTLNGVTNFANSLNNPAGLLYITVLNDYIQLTANVGETIDIYNTIGQKLINKIAVEGLNKFHINTHGILIVKAGNRVGKIIL